MQRRGGEGMQMYGERGCWLWDSIVNLEEIGMDEGLTGMCILCPCFGLMEERESRKMPDWKAELIIADVTY